VAKLANANVPRCYWFAHFQYHADEQMLEISNIPWQEAADWWDEENDDDYTI
jgi:hypothetical protein